MSTDELGPEFEIRSILSRPRALNFLRQSIFNCWILLSVVLMCLFSPWNKGDVPYIKPETLAIALTAAILLIGAMALLTRVFHLLHVRQGVITLFLRSLMEPGRSGLLPSIFMIIVTTAFFYRFLIGVNSHEASWLLWCALALSAARPFWGQASSLEVQQSMRRVSRIALLGLIQATVFRFFQSGHFGTPMEPLIVFPLAAMAYLIVSVDEIRDIHTEGRSGFEFLCVLAVLCIQFSSCFSSTEEIFAKLGAIPVLGGLLLISIVFGTCVLFLRDAAWGMASARGIAFVLSVANVSAVVLLRYFYGV